METHDGRVMRRELVKAACEAFRLVWGRDGGSHVKAELARYISWGWEPFDAAHQVAADLGAEQSKELAA